MAEVDRPRPVVFLEASVTLGVASEGGRYSEGWCIEQASRRERQLASETGPLGADLPWASFSIAAAVSWNKRACAVHVGGAGVLAYSKGARGAFDRRGRKAVIAVRHAAAPRKGGGDGKRAGAGVRVTPAKIGVAPSAGVIGSASR